MSLHAAILEVANEMALEADKLGLTPFGSTLKGYALSLRMACKAAGPELMDDTCAGLLVPPAVQHAMEIEKYRSEFRKVKSSVVMEERYDGDMVEVVAGPANPDGTPLVQSI